MKNDALIEKNNELREQLNPENNKFYSDFMVYVRLKSLDKDERATELQLLAILQDLIDAQNDGVSAQDYFGKSPQAVGDDLIKNLPYSLKSMMKFTFWGIGMYLFTVILPAMSNQNKSLDLGNLILSSVVAILGVLIIVSLFGGSVYKPNNQIKATWLKVIPWFAWGILITGLLLISIFVKTPWQIRLAGWSGIAVISVVLGVGLVIFLRVKDKKTWWGVAFFIGLSGLVGIGERIPAINHYLQMKLGKSGWGLLLVLVFTLFAIMRWRYLKNRNKSEAAHQTQQEGER